MDDLLDLNWSANVNSGPSSKPLQPSQAKSISKPIPSSFDFLAKPTTSTNGTSSSPNYYSSTPLRSGTPLSQPPISATVRVQSTSKSAQASGTSTPIIGNSNDAFSGLFSLGGSSNDNSRTVSMAERQAQVAEQQRIKAENERKQFEANGDFWDKLGGGSTAGPSRPTTSSAPLQPVPTRPKQYENLLQPTGISRPSSSLSQSSSMAGVVPASATSVLSKSSANSFLDDNDDFLNAASGSRPDQQAIGASSKSPRPIDPFDFDQLAAVEPVRNGGKLGTSGMRTPVSDFDFGDKTMKDEDDEHGWLSAMNKPVNKESKPRESMKNTSPRRDPTSILRSKATTRVASPPPHVVGRIVEMGFSPAQARAALAKTSTGEDVEAAMEILLAGKASRSQDNEQEDSDEDYDRVERERIRREEEEKERRRRRRAGPSRDTVKARTAEELRESRGGTETSTPTQFGEQADQILAQASEIGQNVFSRATSLWNSGKDKAMKVYEEQRKAYEAQQRNGSDSKGKIKDGRPRWMVEAEQAEQDWPQEKSVPSGFRDEDGDSPPRPRREAPSSSKPNGLGATVTERARQRPPEPKEDRYISTKERADLLFSDEAPKYVSANRHRKPAPSQPNATSAVPSRPARSAAIPSAPLPKRNLVEASNSQLQRSSAAKAKGNDHFKLGRFTEAETAYTSAVSSLPENHLHLVPLLNNRAATFLKLGESSKAAEDCTTVITLIGLQYHPSKEAPLPPEIASEVKLADGFVKAHVKRAQAWEMGEKWKKAVEDWEKVIAFDAIMMGGGAVSTRNIAADGLRRSKAMLNGIGSGGSSKITSNGSSRSTTIGSDINIHPRPKPKTAAPVSRSETPANPDKSQAVSSLRQAAQAQDKEDEQRLAVKDSVDAKLIAWKGGKETNLRALIASLDTVLWDEILSGGLKVGMHELISEKQVKIKYMKVIARLHPDKLDVKKTTVEQRMLANGAFSALNEAWVAFNGA